MKTLSQAQIAELNNWISNQYDGLDKFYQSLSEISMAYARMYVTLSDMNASDEARFIGKKQDLYVLSELMNIFKPE